MKYAQQSKEHMAITTLTYVTVGKFAIFYEYITSCLHRKYNLSGNKTNLIDTRQSLTYKIKVYEIFSRA